MRNKIKQIIEEIKKSDKKRTINLALFLALLIGLPFILNAPQKYQNTPARAQIVPQGVFPIYGTYATNLDTLKPEWTAHITEGAVSGAYDLYNKRPVYCGQNSISWTVSSPYQQLELTAPQSFNISPYTYLTLYAQAGMPGQRIGAALIDSIDANGNAIISSATPPIEQYGGIPVMGSWTVYNIPVTAFNATNKTIQGIALKELNGGTQDIQPPPPIYFDEINFSTQLGEDIPCATAGAAQISLPPPTEGVQMPYYPNISPWVFIIPGIIVGLAIIFQ